MFIIAADYSGALVSFFSVEVYPKNPETFEDLAKVVAEEDSKIRICCLAIKEAMEESSMESFQLLSQPERVKETFILCMYRYIWDNKRIDKFHY